MEVELEVGNNTQRKDNRNSLSMLYHNHTVLRKSAKLLGHELITDEFLDTRVKWGQRGVSIFTILASIFYVLSDSIHILQKELEFICIGCLLLLNISVVLFMYKNISFAAAKRLLQEPNVIIITMLSLCIVAIDFLVPTTRTSPMFGLLYMLLVISFAFYDVIKMKSRAIVLIVGFFFTLNNLYVIYDYTFNKNNIGVVLFKYNFQGQEYTIMKRATKRAIFIQIFLFSVSGIWILLKDSKMELFMFVTGNIYRETGTTLKTMVQTPCVSFRQREVEPGIVLDKPKRENEQPKSEDETLKREIQKNEISSKDDEGMEFAITINTRRKVNRNSLSMLYHNNTVLRKSAKLLGHELITDEFLDTRVKWGQRGVAILFCLGCSVFLITEHDKRLLLETTIFSIVCAALYLFAIVVFLYKNISFAAVKRLLQEPNVIIITMLSLCIVAIDFVVPSTSSSAIFGLLYMLIIISFTFCDAIKMKSRVVVLVFGLFLILLNIYLIYDYTFNNNSIGVVLFKYNFQGQEYTIMKRATKRAIFIQIFLFSTSGIWILLKDSKMELFMFVTGNIYRETGTTFKHVR
jgi:hypothetical protein